jgi:hypothetical protein
MPVLAGLRRIRQVIANSWWQRIDRNGGAENGGRRQRASDPAGILCALRPAVKDEVGATRQGDGREMGPAKAGRPGERAAGRNPKFGYGTGRRPRRRGDARIGRIFSARARNFDLT